MSYTSGSELSKRVNNKGYKMNGLVRGSMKGNRYGTFGDEVEEEE